MNLAKKHQTTAKFSAPDAPLRSVRKAPPGAGFTLVELMVASAISILTLGGLMVSFIVMSQSFNAIGNYSDLDRQSRKALDTMARDIRQTGRLTNWASTNLTFTNVDGTLLTYSFDVGSGTLSYANADTLQSGVLLSNCTSLTFNIFQRTPTNGSICFWPASNPLSAKGILMTFTCVKTNFGSLTDTESVETASIVMRN